MPVVQLYIFLAQWRLVLSESAVYLFGYMTRYYYLLLSLLPWQWFSFTITLYHKILELFYLWYQSDLKLQENCAINAQAANHLKTAVIVTFLARSLALHRTAEPQEALWHFGGQCGATDCQNCKMYKCANLTKMCQNCQKNVQSSKSPKITKNSTFRVKPGILKGVCVRVFSECQSVHPRPRQAQEPCPAFPRLLQLNPARSGPRSLAQLPKGPGRVLSIQGASQRSYKAQESFSVPRDEFRSSPGKTAIPAHRKCAQDWNAHGFWFQETSEKL